MELGIFAGIKMGENGTEVSLLQFADDTLIMGEASERNLWAPKAVPRSFELVSGMRINFHKSCFVGINSGVILTT
jgi:hypothetical protein